MDLILNRVKCPSKMIHCLNLTYALTDYPSPKLNILLHLWPFSQFFQSWILWLIHDLRKRYLEQHAAVITLQLRRKRHCSFLCPFITPVLTCHAKTWCCRGWNQTWLHQICQRWRAGWKDSNFDRQDLKVSMCSRVEKYSDASDRCSRLGARR